MNSKHKKERTKFLTLGYFGRCFTRTELMRNIALKQREPLLVSPVRMGYGLWALEVHGLKFKFKFTYILNVHQGFSKHILICPSALKMWRAKHTRQIQGEIRIKCAGKNNIKMNNF
jgi:hypothetical protein